MSTIAKNLQSLRKEAGLSQTKLSKLSGVAASTINEIENLVVKDIRLSTISALAKILEVEPLEVITPSSFDFKNEEKEEFQQALKTLMKISKKML